MAKPFDFTGTLFESAKAEKGVIRGVKIIGHISKNGGGRRYTESALKQAVGLYEGAKVYLNHPKGEGDRDARDVLGHFEGVVAKPDGLYGDLYHFESHEFAPRLQEAVTNKKLANNIGMSHNATGKMSRKDGKQVVESIEAVHSVDLVSDPATVRGLFESVEASYSDDPQATTLNPNKTVSEVIFDILTSDDEEDAKLERIRSLLAAMNASKPGENKPDESEPDESGDDGEKKKPKFTKESVAMTAEEKKEFDALKESVKKQGDSLTESAKLIKSQAARIACLEAELPPTKEIVEALAAKDEKDWAGDIVALKESAGDKGGSRGGTAKNGSDDGESEYRRLTEAKGGFAKSIR